MRYYSEDDVRSVLAYRDEHQAEEFARAEPSLTLRPEVAAFAQAMEQKLQANDHKPHWRDYVARVYVPRLVQECGELAAAVLYDHPPEDVLGEAADVANFAMMIADVAGGLKGE